MNIFLSTLLLLFSAVAYASEEKQEEPPCRKRKRDINACNLIASRSLGQRNPGDNLHHFRRTHTLKHSDGTGSLGVRITLNDIEDISAMFTLNSDPLTGRPSDAIYVSFASVNTVKIFNRNHAALGLSPLETPRLLRQVTHVGSLDPMLFGKCILESNIKFNSEKLKLIKTLNKTDKDYQETVLTLARITHAIHLENLSRELTINGTSFLNFPSLDFIHLPKETPTYLRELNAQRTSIKCVYRERICFKEGDRFSADEEACKAIAQFPSNPYEPGVFAYRVGPNGAMTHFN